MQWPLPPSREGDLDRAAERLETAAASLAPLAQDSAIAGEIDDLKREAGRMRARLYRARDRKYQSARALAARELDAEYAARVSRRPGKP